MIRRAASQPGAPAASALELEQRIQAVESRMMQRRLALQDTWVGLGRQMDQALSARTWLWPLLMGMAGGCLFGLLWRRGSRGQDGPPVGRRAAWWPGGFRATERRAGHEGRGSRTAGPGLRLLLLPLLQQWLRPALVQAGEGLLRTLLNSLQKGAGAGGGPRKQDPDP